MLCDGLVRSVIYKSCIKAIEVIDFRFSDRAKIRQSPHAEISIRKQ